jgi:hypothetical protein
MRPLKVPLGEGRTATLRRFRYMPFGWVHPADYILCELPDPTAGVRPQLELALPNEPLVVPAPLMASALAALARAAARQVTCGRRETGQREEPRWFPPLSRL